MYQWFDLWFDDKQSILDTMVKNLKADLEAGYNYFGHNIINQRKLIDEYKNQFDKELKNLREMDYKKAEHWCYIDLHRRGAIS